MKKNIFYVLFLLCFSTAINAQKKWQPFAGLHLSLNSDAYYVGPSFSAGAQHLFGKSKNWSFTPSIHYFQNKKKNQIDASTYEGAKFVSYSLRSTFNYFTGKKKKFFAGAGLGIQHADDECYTYINGEIDESATSHYYEFEYTRLMFSINFGYSVSIRKNNSLEFLISGIGPYRESNGYGSYTEILSVLDLGVRFVF